MGPAGCRGQGSPQRALARAQRGLTAASAQRVESSDRIHKGLVVNPSEAPACPALGVAPGVRAGCGETGPRGAGSGSTVRAHDGQGSGLSPADGGRCQHLGPWAGSGASEQTPPGGVTRAEPNSDVNRLVPCAHQAHESRCGETQGGQVRGCRLTGEPSLCSLKPRDLVGAGRGQRAAEARDQASAKPASSTGMGGDQPVGGSQ